MLKLNVGSQALLGLSLLAVVGLAVAAQTNPSGQALWPPPRSQVLNVFEEFSTELIIPGNGTHVVVTVPPDKWLTITGAAAWNQNGSLGNVRWVEIEPSGTMVAKGCVTSGVFHNPTTGRGSPEASPAGSGGPVGWTFAPGSSVALFNGPGGSINVRFYSLLGYYSRT